MRPLSRDTSPQAEDVLVRLAREMPARRKFQLAASMTETVRRLAVAGIRERHPNATEDEVRKRYAALVLPRDLVVPAFGWDPALEGY
jgi:hypothetical protein